MNCHYCLVATPATARLHLQPNGPGEPSRHWVAVCDVHALTCRWEHERLEPLDNADESV